MTIEEVREYAEAYGILSLMKFSNMEDLIRTIQLATGEEPCFGEEGRCLNERCNWKDECLLFKRNEGDGKTDRKFLIPS